MENLMPDPFVEMHQANMTDTLFVGRKIQLHKSILVTLGRTVMHQPQRGTCVVEGTSDEWPDMDLVVKISWPASSRVSESTFVEQIKAAAEDAAWVLDHIPTILHSQDFPLQPDSPGTKLEAYPDVKFIDNKAFHYEHRVCRVSVHERLYHLDALKKYAQVIFDVLQVHRWIYDHPRIIHRDLSQGNIMWHRRRGRICGVLNDFDLSSSRDATLSDKQCTGTLPFMAHELHHPAVNGHPPIHLYRHDLESIFYIIILLTCAHTLAKEPDTDGSYLRADKSSTFHSWFSKTDEQLYDKKHAYAMISVYNVLAIPVPDNSFTEFTAWLKGLYQCFEKGMANRGQWEREAPDEEEDMDVDENAPPRLPFDEETMDGAVTYDAILTVMKTFGRIKHGKNGRVKLEVMYPIAKMD